MSLFPIGAVETSAHQRHSAGGMEAYRVSAREDYLTGVVAIGRNEGDRLRRCLASVAQTPHCVYVDSASSDDSVVMARSMGVAVVELGTPPALSAARGRNAGLAHLLDAVPDLRYIQFVDGDCEVQPGWMDSAVAALEADSGLGIVFGRRRERYPDASIYNALCDDEWNVPVGEAQACGGDIMARVEAIRAVGGYDAGMIAGEDPDLAYRIRKAGWRLRRLDAEMTLHDAAILRFGQWWKRATRAGHAYAELARRHPERKRQRLRVIFWGIALPLLASASLLAALVIDARLGLVLVAVAALWFAQALRIARRRRHNLPRRIALAYGLLLMTGKFAEAIGLLRFERGRLGAGKAELIEYKGVSR